MMERKETKSSALPPVAVGLLIAATGWFMLQQLAPLLRPLLLAVFLCYAIVPGYHKARQRFPGKLAFLLFAGGIVLVLYIVGLVLQGNIVALQEELPRLTERATKIFGGAHTLINEHLPWLIPDEGDTASMDSMGISRLKDMVMDLLNVAANVFLEGGLVGIYLLFLLLEVPHLPHRLRAAFPQERGEQIFEVAHKINDSIAGYLRVKVVASFFLAVPIAVGLWLFGVKFPVLWGLLNFFANFIPYLGSILGFSLPVLFTFLDLDPGWQPVAATGIVLATHLVMAYVVEPRMTGKAVGLSPLVILISLSFWGLCWGIVGMFLATPLTVICKIILSHIPYTAPLAKLLGDE